MGGFFSVSSKNRIQAKSGSSSISSIAGSYQNSVCCVDEDRSRDFAPAGELLSCSRTKVTKERDPTVCVPALRCGQTCATPFGLRCGKTRFALRAPLRQVAANLKTKHWHSAVPMPAARTACHRRRHTGECGCGRHARVLTKLASSPYLDCGSSYQFHKEAIWLSAFGIAPFCPRLRRQALGLAAAPQSAAASCSDLRPFV